MDKNEKQWEKLLKIKTTGRDDSRSGQYRYPYEPTPYCVLERLANSGYITKKNTVIDYGCGKGRVDFFLAAQVRCRTIGVEYDERIYTAAETNKSEAAAGVRTDFINENAETFVVPKEADCCYFFNPFSVELLHKVTARIMESFYENPRKITLFFYYPSDEYVGYLMTQAYLMFIDEIDCTDLFGGTDKRERIMIFEVMV